MAVRYKRVLLKLSGEMLAGEQKMGLDPETVHRICTSIRDAHNEGAEIGIVVGGGNFWRGRTSSQMDRVRADHMGMLATTINSLALADALEQIGVDVRVQTAIEMRDVAEMYIRGRALSHLAKGRVLIFGCGTGRPYFSTDTAAALRAAEIDAEVILKATKVDGVYDSDPMLNEDAKKYDVLTYHEIVAKSLGVMDSTAATMCSDNKIPILVFSVEDPHNIVRAIQGEKIGTIVQ